MDTPRVATVRETADLLRLGRTRIYELLNDGTLKSVKLGGKRLVLRASIDAIFADAA